MNTKTKITALATTTLLLVGFAGPPAQAAPEKIETAPLKQNADAPVAAPVASLNFDRVSVKTSQGRHVRTSTPPTPVAVAPVTPKSVPTAPVRTQKTPTVPTTRTAPTKPSTTPVAPKVSAKTTAAVAPAAPVAAAKAVGSGSGAALLASARSQIGRTQDCTAMVERALGSIGIVTGDIGPAAFFRFGTVVSTPAPGDILISAGHVGIYAGDGMMVSGGFNNLQTVLHPVKYVGGFTAVRVA